MDIKILNFYFNQIGFKKRQNKTCFNYIRKNYEVKIFTSVRKLFILKDETIIYETGMPTKEPSIAKWCNILIDKYEKENS